MADEAASAGASGSAATAWTPPGPSMLALAEQCGVIDVSTVHVACPDDVATGSQRLCTESQLNEQCSYFQFALDDRDKVEPPILACSLRCAIVASSFLWTGPCAECARTCPPRPPDGVAHELDTSDCLQRPLTPCAMAYSTTQTSLDATLSGLLRSDAAARGELQNGALQLELEDGCVTAFYPTDGDRPFDHVADILVPALSGARFDCAQQLSCGRIQGPDTLATP